jgi:hypothetical protein
MIKNKILPYFLCCIILFNSCSYFHLRKANPKQYKISLEEKQMQKSHVFIHIGDRYFKFTNWKKENNNLKGTIEPVPTELDLIYQKANSKRYIRKHHHKRKDFMQLHLFLQSANIQDKEISFELAKIEKIEILKDHPGLTILSWTTSSLATLVSIDLIVLWIICGCPHVYQNDGEQWYFSNSIFTGAMNPMLERIDLKKIIDSIKSSNDLTIEIRNEEKEIQYTNLLKLISIYHEQGEEIIPSTKNEFIAINQASKPFALKNDNTILDNQYSISESNTYVFNTINKFGFSTLEANFELNDYQNTYLVLGVKNPSWGGYVYNEFTKLFGNYFQKWVNSNAKKSKTQLEKNIKKSGIKLGVEVFNKGKWENIEYIDLVGEAKFEKIGLEIPRKYLNDKELKIRLKSGFQFWELNHLSIAEKKNKTLTINEHDAQIINDSANLKSDALSKDDRNYVIHSEGEKPIQVYFSGLKSTENRSLFLKSKGYYKTVKTYEGSPQWKKLLAIQKDAGLSIYSKQKYEEWIEVIQLLSSLGLTEKIMESKK